MSLLCSLMIILNVAMIITLTVLARASDNHHNHCRDLVLLIVIMAYLPALVAAFSRIILIIIILKVATITR